MANHDRPVRNTNDARQGENKGVSAILVWSLGLAILAGIAFAIYAATQP